MYRPSVSLGAGAAGAAGSLAATGASIVWWLVAGFTMLVAGIALLQLVPRRER